MALCVIKRMLSSHPVTLLFRSETGVSISELHEPSSPWRRKKGTGRLTGISEMNLQLRSPFPRRSKTNGNILGKVILRDDSPGAGGLRQRLFKEKGHSSVYAWPGRSPLQSWLGTAPGSQVMRQAFKDLGHCCSLLPVKIQKVSSSLQLTSQVPECTASFIHSLIHSLTPHAFIKSLQCVRHGG